MTDFGKIRSHWHGPKWFRFGWSERMNGLGRVIGKVYVVSAGSWNLRLERKAK